MVAKSVLLRSAVATTSVLAATAAARSVDAKSLIRWTLRHGLAGASMRIAARQGDPFGRLTYDPAIRADPYALYDEIRAAGDVVPGKVVMVTARHDVISEVLRAPEFHTGFPDELLPPAMQAMLGWAREPGVLGPVERPSMPVSNGEDHLRSRRLVAARSPRAR